MARALPVKNKTVTVRSTVTVAGMSAGQIAEVDDSKATRDLISSGLWVLLVTKASAAPAPAPEPAPAPVASEEPIVEE